MPESPALQERWLQLVRVDLPMAAAKHPEWPVRLDHCFMRIILDAICERPWRTVLKTPAYQHLSDAQLQQAIALAEAILQGDVDLAALNRQSLSYRGKLK